MTFTERQTDTIIQYLCDGYGVEDIGVKMGLPVDDLRTLIKQFRAEGLLKEIYGNDSQSKEQ